MKQQISNKTNQNIIKSNKQSNTHYLYSFKCGISSFLATTISVTLLHPLQLIKVRFQSHDGQTNQENVVPKYRSLYNAFNKIILEQGYKGLYKGMSISIIGAAISSSLFFSIYENRKKHLLKQKSSWYIFGDKQSDGKMPQHQQMVKIMLAGIESGIIVTLITQPIWVVKTRMLLNIQNVKFYESKKGSHLAPIINTIKQIKTQHNISGFYKGMSMNLILSFNGALNMLLYQTSKKIYDKLQIPQTNNFMQKNFICGGLSKICNVLFTYPLTTIRTRIQQNQFVKIHPNEQKYHNVWEIIKKTMQKQGIRGFYKGMLPNIIRGIPERGIYFFFYEHFKKIILSQDQMMIGGKGKGH